MISQKENSTGYKMIPVGNKEDYSFITTDIYDASYRYTDYKHPVVDYLDRCIEELLHRVSKLEELVDSKMIIIESCEEMYAEEWRET